MGKIENSTPIQWNITSDLLNTQENQQQIADVVLFGLEEAVIHHNQTILDDDVMQISRIILTSSPVIGNTLIPFLHDCMLTQLPVIEALQAASAVEARAPLGSYIRDIAGEDVAITTLELVGITQTIYEKNLALFLEQPLPFNELKKYSKRKKLGPAEIADICVSVVQKDSQKSLESAQLLQTVSSKVNDPIQLLQIYLAIENGFEKLYRKYKENPDDQILPEVKGILTNLQGKAFLRLTPDDNKFERYLEDIPVIQ